MEHDSSEAATVALASAILAKRKRVQGAVDTLRTLYEMGGMAGSVLAAQQAVAGLTPADPEKAKVELEERIRTLAGRTDELEDVRRRLENALVVLKDQHGFRSLRDVLRPNRDGETISVVHHDRTARKIEFTDV